MLEAGVEKALGKLLALLSYDTDIAQNTKEVLLNLVWDLGCVFKGALSLH